MFFKSRCTSAVCLLFSICSPQLVLGASAKAVKSLTSRREDATEILHQTGLTYAKLKSLTFDCRQTDTTVVSVPGNNVPETHTDTMLLHISFVKPNLISIIKTDAQGTTHVVCDGRHLYACYPSNMNEYLRTDAPQNQQAMLAAFEKAGFLFGNILLGGTRSNSGLLDLRIGQQTRVGSVPVDEIQWSPGHNGITMSYLISRQDHLLHCLRMTTAVPGVTSSSVLTFDHLVQNPPLTSSDFRFKWTAGRTASTKLLSPIESMMQKVQSQADASLILRPGMAPPPLDVADIKGLPISLNAEGGKVVLLDFWATWCGPCMAEMPNVVSSYHEFHSSGFDVIGVCLDNEQTSKHIAEFAVSHSMTWPIIYDGMGWQSLLAKRYGVTSIPRAILIGRDGKVISVDARGGSLKDLLKTALSEPANINMQSPPVSSSNNR